MKLLTTFLVFILLFSLSKTSFSQKKDSGDDVYNTNEPKVDNSKYFFINDTEFDIDNFVKGYIILPTNTVQHGLVKFNGSVVVFKDTLTKKNKRYDAQELKGFTAQADTSDKNLKPHMKNGLLTGFTRVGNRKSPLESGINGLQIRVDTFKVLADSYMVKYAGGHAAPGDRLVHNNKFIRQEIYGTNVCLYKITEQRGTSRNMMNGTLVNVPLMNSTIVNAPLMNGNVNGIIIQPQSYLQNSFYLKRKNETQYTLVPERKKPFKKFAAEYLKDNPQLVLDIEQEKLTYNNIDDIVLRYNNTNNAR